MNTIYIEIKNIYGNQNAYPACDKSILFTRLTGKKTLSTNDFKTIQDLGYKIEFRQPKLTLDNLR